MSKFPYHRRDELLHDTFADDAVSALPARMAARVRRTRRIRHAATAGAVVACALAAFFIRSQPATSSGQPSAVIANQTPSPQPPSPAIPLATDAELMDALAQESVIIFTLADGQREVVWLDGRPGI